MIYTELESRPATFRERFYMVGMLWRVMNDVRREGRPVPFVAWLLPLRHYIFRVRPMVTTDYIVNYNKETHE